MVPGDSAVQQQAEPAVVEVSKSVRDSEDFLDRQVDRFGGSVADPTCAEIGQELGAPGGDGARQRPISGTPGRPPMRRGDLAALVAGPDPGQQPRPGGGGEVLGSAAQHAADSVERVGRDAHGCVVARGGARRRRRRIPAAPHATGRAPAPRAAARPTGLRRSRRTGPGRRRRSARSTRRAGQKASRPTIFGCGPRFHQNPEPASQTALPSGRLVPG